VGGTCSPKGRHGKNAQHISLKIRKIIDFFRDLDIEGRSNFKLDSKEIGLEGMDRIHLAQDRDQWRVLVKTNGNETSGYIKCSEFIY
jgi:hypothetical protein